MDRPILAAQLYTIREFTQTAADFAASLQKIRDIGYTAVQVSAIGPIPHQEVWDIVSDLGLTVCNTHIGFDKLQSDLDDVIAQHKLWQTRHVALGSMPEEFRTAEEDSYKRFAAIANQIGEKLYAHDLTFSYHNHNFEFVRFGTGATARTGLDVIYEETDPRYVQAEIDTYWVQHGGGDPAAWIVKMKDRMPVVHLKDMVILNGEQTMAEVGEGNMNFPAILAACQEANVEWYAVEQDICQRDPFESLRISFENLNAMGYR
ncbi:MAG: sugar phosphate isomerase/epimerase [Anaerolineae bacterium]|nr:sugar phosphate isomerase/epimerase [Anaerolineae bacterium]